MPVTRRLRSALWLAVSRGATAAQRMAELMPAGRTLGVELLVDPREPAPAAALAKVGAAVALIADVDPRRFGRLARDVRAIAVLDGRYLRRANGAHLTGTATCYVRAAVAERYSAARVAVLLVHEATHARLDGLRTVLWWPPVRARMEYRCLVEELAFVGRLPRDEYPGADTWRDDRLRQSGYAPAGRWRSAGTTWLGRVT